MRVKSAKHDLVHLRRLSSGVLSAGYSRLTSLLVHHYLASVNRIAGLSILSICSGILPGEIVQPMKQETPRQSSRN
jgi:hypothetical protein